MPGRNGGFVIPLIVVVLGGVVVDEMITGCHVYWNNVIARNVEG